LKEIWVEISPKTSDSEKLAIINLAKENCDFILKESRLETLSGNENIVLLSSLDENKIKRLNLATVKLILADLDEKDKTKRTRLALRCQIPYHRFIQFMDTMIKLDLIVLEETPEGKFVNITNLGKNYLNR